MNQFSLGNAWSKGVSFFSSQALNHAIVLIGLGVLVPTIVQYAIAGGVTGMMNPAMMSAGGLGAFSMLGGAAVIAMIISYVLQLGSYFGSWRLGFGEGEPLGGAIVYGLIAGVLVIVAFVAVFIIGGLVLQASPVLGAIVMALLLLPLFAALYTVWAALVAVVMFLLMVLVLAFGASMGNVNPAAQFTGGGALAVLFILAILAVLLWLTARFSCATPIMADRRTFNLMTGLSESWRLTSTNQWRIVGYLSLLAVVLMVLFFVVAMIIGAGMAQSFQGGGVPEISLGMIIGGIVVGVPLAYLTVLVPAGIYRELGGGETSAKVFA